MSGGAVRLEAFGIDYCAGRLEHHRWPALAFLFGRGHVIPYLEQTAHMASTEGIDGGMETIALVTCEGVGMASIGNIDEETGHRGPQAYEAQALASGAWVVLALVPVTPLTAPITAGRTTSRATFDPFPFDSLRPGEPDIVRLVIQASVGCDDPHPISDILLSVEEASGSLPRYQRRQKEDGLVNPSSIANLFTCRVCTPALHEAALAF